MPTKAFVFSAPSGSGKTTIVRHLLDKLPELSFSISATTRQPRAYEKHGKDYYFLSDEEFDALLEEDGFLEWEEVYEGVKYGTLRREVYRIWEQNQSVVFDIDVVGGLNIKEKLGDQVLAVFVKAPGIEQIKERLTIRSTESEETLKIRIGKAIEELEYEPRFDVTLINDQLEDALTEAERLVSEFLTK